MCNCGLCISNREIMARINGMTPEYRAFTEGLLERALHVEFDRDYYQAILQGDWPSSVEILEEALKRAKEKRNGGNQSAE